MVWSRPWPASSNRGAAGGFAPSKRNPRLLRNRSGGAIAQRKVVLVHRVVLVLEGIVNQPPTQSRDCLFYLIRHAAY